MIKVVMTAMAIPIMPKRLPCLADVGDDSPFRARIKKIAATK
jgi:hypothetical protein